MKKYFTGKPCKYGHVGDRYSITGHCVICIRAHNAKWQKENPERYKLARDRWRSDNAAHFLELQKRWALKNPDRDREKYKKYAVQNRGKRAADAARRRALMSQSTPPWADEKAIEQYYVMSRAMSVLIGIPFEVDHTVPLLSEVVCGLHTHSNLTILPAFLNRSKSNRHWPDMPA